MASYWTPASTSCAYEPFYRADPDKPGRWISGLKGVEPVLYRLPDVLAAIASRSPVILCEGEKDADNLTKLGFTATTSPMGAGKWRDSYTATLRGADVFLCGDNDEPGRKHVATVAAALQGVAASVKVIDLAQHWPELPAKADITDYLKTRCKSKAAMIVEVKALMESAVDFANIANDAEWPEIVPFDTIDTPPFPVESLPPPVAAYVEALSESTQTPTEMGALLSLCILAIAFQGRYEVEITPDWKEPLCLYTVAVAPPGERKSAVISALAQPVYEYEAEMRAFEAEEIAQNQTERAMLEKALANAQSNATKKKCDTEGSREEALVLAAELATFKDKHPFRLLVDDTTSEKLVDIMDVQGGKIAVASAEGGIFDAMAGRYDKNANFDVYLKGHAGDPITVDRIGRKSNYIPKPRLTMMLTIQPEVLNGLMGNSTFRGRGLCGRFYAEAYGCTIQRRADTLAYDRITECDLMSVVYCNISPREA